MTSKFLLPSLQDLSKVNELPTQRNLEVSHWSPAAAFWHPFVSALQGSRGLLHQGGVFYCCILTCSVSRADPLSADDLVSFRIWAILCPEFNVESASGMRNEVWKKFASWNDSWGVLLFKVPPSCIREESK